MLHGLITLGLSIAGWFFGLHQEIACIVAAFYAGREHAQAEYRAIKTLYGGKRVNAPWWCGFELRAWDSKALLDWLVPVIIVVGAIFM